MEDEPMMGDDKKSKKTDEDEDQVENFLCCTCHTPAAIKNLSCCCCFPIRCGMNTICFFIWALTLFAIIEIFFELENDYVYWWYVLVGMICLIPAIIAMSFVVQFCMKEDDSTRGKMVIACLLVMLSAALMALWIAIYFLSYYKS